MVFYEARWLVPVSGPPIEGGARVVHEGRILAAGRASTLRSTYPDAPRKDFGDSVLSAAPINAHTHLELSWIGNHTLPEGKRPESESEANTKQGRWSPPNK